MPKPDLLIVEKQEQELIFERFDEDVAFELGSYLRQRATELNKPVSIAVELWDRRLFWATMASLTADNESWIARKMYVVRRFHHSSYHMALRYDHGAKFDFGKWGFAPELAAFHGGAFPITVAGAGCIGAAAVSGLPDREDHNLVVEGICMMTGKNPGDWKLPD